MTEAISCESSAPWQIWERVLLRAGFLFLPMQEGPQTIAWYALCLALLFKDKKWLFAEPLRKKWLRALALVLFAALAMGTLAVFWHGYELRTSKASRVFSGLAVLVGLKLALDRDENEWRTCWWYFLGGLVLSCLAGLSQYFYGSFPLEYLWHDSARGWQGQLYIPGTQTPCASGLHRNRMRFAEILIMGFVLLFSYRGPIWKMMSPWAAGTLAVLTAFTAYLTHSWMAVFVSLGAWLLVFILKTTRQVWLAKFAVAASVGGMFLIPIIGSVLRAMSSTGAQATGKLEVRQWLWSTGLDGFLENPLLGKGFGGYGIWAMEHLGIQAANVRDPHSWWLATSTQAGIAGLMLMIMIAAIFLAFAWSYKSEQSAVEFAPGQAEIIGACCALMVIGIVQDVFFYHGFAQFSWLLVGLALGTFLRDGSGAQPKNHNEA